MRFNCIAVVLALLLSCFVASGQQVKDKLTVSLKDVTLSEALARIEDESGYTFFLDEEQVDPGVRVTLVADGMPMEEALGRLLAGTGLTFEIRQRQIALFPAVKGVDVEVFRLSSAGVYPAGEPVAVGVHAVESHTVSPLRRAG